MNDKGQTGSAAGSLPDWSSLWQSMAESSNRMVEAWSSSIAPFMLSRVSEKATGEVNDLSAAIERMARGPQLADVWDFDRKVALAFGAWIELRARLASYNAVTAAPWTEASRRFLEAVSKNKAEGTGPPDWRGVF